MKIALYFVPSGTPDDELASEYGIGLFDDLQTLKEFAFDHAVEQQTPSHCRESGIKATRENMKRNRYGLPVQYWPKLVDIEEALEIERCLQDHVLPF